MITTSVWYRSAVTVLAVASVMANPMAAQHSGARPVAVGETPKPEVHTAAAAVTFARSVTVRLDRVSLRSALDAVAASAEVTLQYKAAMLDVITTPVTLHAVEMPLGEALDRLLTGTGLRASSPLPQVVTIKASTVANATALGVITGTMTNATTKQPLRGVAIILDEATRGVVTGEDGTYRLIGVSAGPHRVIAKLLGYRRDARTVTVADGQTVVVDIALEASASTLDQVVVTGTIIPTELKAVPNAITVITAKQIEERGITHIDQLFRGDVPGLFAQNQGAGAALDEVLMFSRGATALPSYTTSTSITNPIKTYVDGVEMADPKYLSQIDPGSIERIEILTGPQASTIYGSNAINGVMQIFTKRGTSNTPQLALNLLSGWVANNFTSALTPQHDYSAQLSGIEGRLSYNAGGSWNYVGAWTPAKQTTRTDAFGGTKIELPTFLGRVTADVTLRRNVTQNRQRGNPFQTLTSYQTTGWYTAAAPGLSTPTTYTLTGQTLGLTLGYTPTAWWSHEFGIGQDASDYEQRYTARGYTSASDTTLFLYQIHADRRSLRYTTTVRVPVAAFAQATVTTGADAWQNLASSWYVQPQTLTGTLSGSTSSTRQPGHNTGGFVQTQLGVMDRLFLTYGLRAEWNPDYGAEAQPSYAPRYGMAYTQEFGSVTAKLRGSYGRSTRPPQPGRKVARSAVENFGSSTWSLLSPYYDNFVYYLANPALGPEYQQGGEGGIELYFGTRGSLVVTRYNQTVDGLIAAPKVDSVRSLTLNPPYYSALRSGSYGYWYQYQYVNVGSIRNQGWELQGSVNAGPLTTKGTYSWTKSRTLGVDPKYRSFFTVANGYPQYQPGATFRYLPEHTWTLGMTYAGRGATIGLDVTGIGRLMNFQDEFLFQNFYGLIRLPQNRLNVNNAVPYISANNGYALVDFAASRQLLPRLDGVLQVQNLADHYTNDYHGFYATLGRQIKVGARVRP